MKKLIDALKELMYMILALLYFIVGIIMGGAGFLIINLSPAIILNTFLPLNISCVLALIISLSLQFLVSDNQLKVYIYDVIVISLSTIAFFILKDKLQLKFQIFFLIVIVYYIVLEGKEAIELLKEDIIKAKDKKEEVKNLKPF